MNIAKLYFRLLFETPYTGGVITSAQMRPLRLLRQNSPTECAIFICEIISLIFVAYYIFREIYAVSLSTTFSTRCIMTVGICSDTVNEMNRIR